MVKIEAYVLSNKFDAVKAALDCLGVQAITYAEIFFHPAGGGPTVHYRGAQYQVDVPIFRVDVLASSLQADEIIEVLCLAARSEESNKDGFVLLYEIADTVQIHTGQRAEFALN